MSTQTIQSLIKPIRVARSVLGVFIAAFGLVVVLTAALPVMMELIQTIFSDPEKRMAVRNSTVAGAATGLGALALITMRKIDARGLGLFIGISAGMMAAAALVSLFLPAMLVDGAAYIAVVAALAGYCLMALLDQTLPHEHPVAGPAMQGQPRNRMAKLMVIAIAIHNVPEGFAVGASMGNGSTGSVGTAFSIGLQNIPEGLIVATALWSIGMRKHWAALLALGTGLVEPLGAGFGVLFAQAWPMGTPASMALAAGAMAFVVVNEMIPEAVKMTGQLKTLYAAGMSAALTAFALGWMGA